MSRREAVRAFAEAYRFENLLASTAAARSPELWLEVLQHLETEDFLALQADRVGGFQASAFQLETHVLPALVELGDWDRFCLYAATAVDLRAVIELLDDPSILQMLARRGRSDLAEAAVGNLARPYNRVDGWAALAVTVPTSSPEFDRWTRELASATEKMDAVEIRRNRDLAAHWSQALSCAGRRLAVALRARWIGWIERLARWGDLADDVRIAVADGFLGAGESEAPELWEVLARVEDSRRLHRLLPTRMSESCADQPRPALLCLRDRLPKSRSDPSLLWAVGLALVSRSDGGADWHWLRRTLPPVPWSADLLGHGAGLLPRLRDDDLDELESEQESAENVALLRTLVAEGRGDPDSCRRALRALHGLPEAEESTSLYLRILAGAAPGAIPDLKPRLRGLLGSLSALRYSVCAENLRRALDLTARHLPRSLRITVERALDAAASGPETLRTLADSSLEAGLLDVLLERAENHAAMVAANAAEGFELRGEILSRLAVRRLETDRDLDAFEKVTERLLPDEEDQLRAQAARLLAGPAPGEAVQIADGIRERRLRLRVRLEVSPRGGEGEVLAPTELYRAASRRETLDFATRVHGCLLDVPSHPGRSTERWLGDGESPVWRIEALVELARHALLYQERHVPQRFRDRSAAILPLQEALGVVESDSWIVSLAPELVSIGCLWGPGRARAEIREAFVQLVGTTTVSWEDRESALLSVLGSLEAPCGPAGARLPDKDVSALISWILERPERMAEAPGVETLRARWYRLLPVVTAIGERSLGRSAPRWRRLLADSARRGAEWTPELRAVYELCSMSSRERLAVADHWIATLPPISPDLETFETVRGLAWLLVRDSPDRVTRLLGRLAESERDRIVLEMVRLTPLDDATARELMVLLDDGAYGDPGGVWAGTRSELWISEPDWISRLAELVAEDTIDPGDPSTASVRRRLWGLKSDRPLRTIADAVIRALAHGGPAAGERALRWFLDAYVRPTPGEEGTMPSRCRHERVRRALGRARTLESADESEHTTSDDSKNRGPSPVSPDGLLRRFLRWRRAWSRRPTKDEDPTLQTETVGLLMGVGAIAFLTAAQGAVLAPDEMSLVSERFAFASYWGLASVSAANVALLGSLLGRMSPQDRTIPLAIRWARTLLASIPLLGFWAVPVWRFLLRQETALPLRGGERRPISWPPEKPSGAGVLERHQALPDRLGSWAARQRVALALFLVNVAATSTAFRVSAGVDSLAGVLAGGLLVLQVGSFVSMSLFFRRWFEKHPGVRRRTQWLPPLSVCWLLPLPLLPVMGLLAFLFLEPQGREATLVHRAFSAERGVERLPAWGSLRERMARQWSRSSGWTRWLGPPESVLPQVEATDTDRRLLWLLQGKGLCLALEAAWLTRWLPVATRGSEPLALEPVDYLVAVAAIGAVLASVVLALVVIAALLTPQMERRIFGPRLFWGHLAGTQWALVVGLEFGRALGGSDPVATGSILAVAGVGGAALQVASLLLLGFIARNPPDRPWDSGSGMVIKVVCYATVGTLGVIANQTPLVGRALVVGLTGASLVAPVVGAGFGLAVLPDLVGPDGSRTRPSRRYRLRRTALALTAVAPLGGLAIPWWIRDRRSRTGH